MNVDCKVAHGVGNSRDMLPVRPRSRGDNRTPTMWREPRASHPGMCARGWCEVEVAHIVRGLRVLAGIVR